MGFEVYGVGNSPGAGQEFTGRVWDVLLSVHRLLLDVAGPVSLVVGAASAVCLIIAAFFPEMRKRMIASIAFALLGLLFLYAVPLFVGLMQYLGNTVQKGGM
ncbi:hypothetical protein [Desulfofundulus thermosubterraneus]|uniref:TrbC/VIRB2 family protein n=1 Tax=Desulfofundulus thermosubterraneus DSM 16057 TaxID=1121432 RepID=A0A1M6L1F4_9FIRM|nr:hypothetical protein [Desulfofundulus thermosubterraneus]SHJ65008.1 hypothetical protein SAMN02745219_03031 [Desulfofundulus thermosubterraneus DSM 16057]